MVEIEAREYGPDSTPDELAAIRARITLHDDQTVMWRELPVMSVFSVDVCCDRVGELCEAHGCRYLIVDARIEKRPNIVIRKRLYDRLSELSHSIVHLAVILDTNPMLRAVARFVQAAMPFEMSLHDTIAEAEAALRSGGMSGRT